MKLFTKLLALTFFSVIVQVLPAQTAALISNPDAGTGFQGSPIVYGSNLYFQYRPSSGPSQLAKYNGTSITLVANPDAGDGFLGSPIVYGSNLYFQYGAIGKNQLAKYDGTSITLIANPDASVSGYSISYPIVHGSYLYFQYINASNKYQLAKYDGASITLVTNPDAGTGFAGGPFVYGSDLYLNYRNAAGTNQLAKYDGTSITLIPNNYSQYAGSPIVYNGNLYLKYVNSSDKCQLVKYNGTSTTYINNPDAAKGYYGSPIVYGSNLYFLYENASGAYQLAKYDGTSVTLVVSPDVGSSYSGLYGEPIVYGSKLYFRYFTASGKYQLAQYDGTSVTLISNPDAGQGPIGYTIAYGTNLYFQYYNASSIRQLAKYDGTSLTQIANPDAASGFNGYLGSPIVYGNTLYFQYKNVSDKYQLAKVLLFWDGKTSNAWSDANNWSTSAVPVSTDPVTIPSGTPNAPINTGTVTVASLTVASGVAITNTGTINVAGALSNAGMITGTVTLNGSSAQTLSGTGILSNLTLNNSTGATISSGNTSITETLTLTSGTLNTGGFLTLKSDANITARLATITSGAISGKVTVERYIPAGNRGFRFLTPTVTTNNFIKANWQEGVNNTLTSYASNLNLNVGYGTHITGSTTGSNGFDATVTGASSLFQFNNTTQAWGNVANTNATNLIAGNAYRLLVRGSRLVNLNVAAIPNTATTLRATGTLLTGAATFGSSSSTPASLPTLASGVGQYSFIGNPYASAIDWNAVSKTGITGFYWTWDPTLSNKGAYVSCFTDGTKSNLSSGVTTAIQSGQAFFIVNSSSVAARQLQITEAHKTTGNTNVFRTQTGTSSMSIQLFLTSNINGTSQDGATVLFNSNYSNAVNDDDAGKFTNVDENIAVQRGNNLMSIETRNVPANPSDTIFLKAWQLTQNNYMLRVSSSNFDAGMNAYLQDSYLNSEIQLNLAGTTDVSFTTTAVGASTAANRFTIVFRSNGALPVTITSFKAFQKTTGIQVEWKTQNEVNLHSYEVEKSTNGILFEQLGIMPANGSAGYLWLDANPKNGNNYYRLKIIEKDGSFKYSSIVNVKIGSIKNVFTIAGNPIKNNTLVLQMENVEKGSYAVSIYNNLGQLMMSKTIVHEGGSATQTIALSNVSVGAYQLSIIGSNVKTNKTIVVE